MAKLRPKEEKGKKQNFDKIKILDIYGNLYLCVKKNTVENKVLISDKKDDLKIENKVFSFPDRLYKSLQFRIIHKKYDSNWETQEELEEWIKNQYMDVKLKQEADNIEKVNFKQAG